MSDLHSQNNNNNSSIISQIRTNANLESDRQRMEYLASVRTELQQAIQFIHGKHVSASDRGNDGSTSSKHDGNICENTDIVGSKRDCNSGFFIMPFCNNNSTSFLLHEQEDAILILQTKLNQVEMALMQVCNDVQNSMDKRR